MDYEALAELARSPSWADRKRAAQGLAPLSTEAADAVLSALLVDPHDTAVIEAAAEALLRRGDVAGWELVLNAYGGEDPEVVDHVERVLNGVCSRTPDTVARMCRTIAAQSANPIARFGAGAALEELGLSASGSDTDPDR